MGPVLLELFNNNEDWRFKYSGFVAAGNLGEYVDSSESLANLVEIIVSHVAHPHPRVRYAAIHCLGLLADECEKEFCELYHEKAIGVLVTAMDDPIERVQRHAIAALSNFIDEIEEEIVDKYADFLMKKLAALTKTTQPVVQECIVMCFSSIALSSPTKFASEYYTDTMAFLIKYMNECKDYKLKKLRGIVIDSISSIAKAVGKETFKPHMAEVIHHMYQIQENELESQDPQKSFLLTSWGRLCETLKQDLVPYLELLMPSLLKLASSIPGMAISGGAQEQVDLEKAYKELIDTTLPSKEEQEKIIRVTTTDLEEKEEAINMISVFFEELGGYLDKYVESFARIVLHVLTRSGAENLRETAAQTLKGLYKAAQNGKSLPPSPEYLLSILRTFIAALMRAVAEETETETIRVMVYSLQELITEGKKFLTREGIMEVYKKNQKHSPYRKFFLTNQKFQNKQALKIKICQKYEIEFDVLNDIQYNLCMKLLNDSKERKDMNKDLKYAEKADEDDIEMMEEENSKENDLQLDIIGLMGCVFKFHPDEAFFLVSEYLSKLIVEWTVTAPSNHKKNMALFIMIDLVEHLGYNRIPTYYGEFVKTILEGTASEEENRRQASLYGIGAIAINSGEYFKNVALKCLEAIKKTVDDKKPKNYEKKKWKITRDNAISSLGKIIKFQGYELAQTVPYWISHLPLKKDEEEGIIQNEILADLILANCKLIIGENCELLESVLKIFVKVLETKQVDESVSLKISQALSFLPKGLEFSFSQQKYFFLSLQKKQQNYLKKKKYFHN